MRFAHPQVLVCGNTILNAAANVMLADSLHVAGEID
jgi:hypothetical protein